MFSGVKQFFGSLSKPKPEDFELKGLITPE